MNQGKKRDHGRCTFIFELIRKSCCLIDADVVQFINRLLTRDFFIFALLYKFGSTKVSLTLLTYLNMFLLKCLFSHCFIHHKIYGADHFHLNLCHCIDNLKINYFNVSYKEKNIIEAKWVNWKN